MEEKRSAGATTAAGARTAQFPPPLPPSHPWKILLHINAPHHNATPRPIPSLDELGRDLLVVSTTRKVISLALPFLLSALFFVLGALGLWLPALACPVLLSFFTYGSVSHDLVHRVLRLPRWINETLLSLIELLGFRSGHAYRLTHLHHHASFPAEDDIEASASRLPRLRALLDGISSPAFTSGLCASRARTGRG